MNINKLLFFSALLAVPAFAVEGIPGAAVANDGAKPPYGQHGAMREACKADPEKCKAEAQARRAACQADPEKCRKERMAQHEKVCAQNPEQCKEMKARMEQRRAQCQADPEKCRQEHAARADQHFKNTDADGKAITKPSELAFYPVPKIFNERVGGHEMWGAIRGAELGDGTIEARSIPQTLQATDLLAQECDLLETFCGCIVKNKSIGVYDGAYKCVELATGKKFVRHQD